MEVAWDRDPAELWDALGDILDVRPAWHADAACKERPDLDFVPTRPDPQRRRGDCERCGKVRLLKYDLCAACRAEMKRDEGWSPVADYSALRATCAGCLVREECLEEALGDPGLRGFWGGTNDKERIVLRRRRTAASKAA